MKATARFAPSKAPKRSTHVDAIKAEIMRSPKNLQPWQQDTLLHQIQQELRGQK